MPYCPICEIFGTNASSFQTLNDCRHIDYNSIKKQKLNKHRHGLSVGRLLIHINHIATCHYQHKWSWSLLCEELLLVSSEPIYLSQKISRLKLCATFSKQHEFCLHFCLQCYHRNIVTCLLLKQLTQKS